jgi:DNA-binding response OmpR family regulator
MERYHDRGTMNGSLAILVVEDDENLRLPLVDNLEDEGYRVDHTDRGERAIGLAQQTDYAVIVLDIMLPDTDGYSVCRKLRAAGVRSAILMLTARTLEDDVVTGFDAGADDYLAKPYRLRELLARVKALVRRGSAPASSGGEDLDGIRIDRNARTVTLPDGEQPELTRTEFDLLVFMFDRPGEALSRDVILENVWGEVIVDPRTVDNFVSNLKKKLGWAPGRKFAFRSVRGVGYRLDIQR